MNSNKPPYGWTAIGTSQYRHHCGAKVCKSGKVWLTSMCDGSTGALFNTRRSALAFLKECDPYFWGFDEPRAWACATTGGILMDLGTVAGRNAITVRTCDRFQLLPLVEATFRRYAFGQAACAKCERTMSSIAFRELTYFGDRVSKYPKDPDRSFRSYPHDLPGDVNDQNSTGWRFAVCSCGSPLWFLDSDFALGVKLRVAQNRWDRMMRSRTADGEYNARDITEIHQRQNGKCRYCEKPIPTSAEWTIDHVVPLASGGSHWPENLCLACRSCNSRKGTLSADEFLKQIAKERKKGQSAE